PRAHLDRVDRCRDLRGGDGGGHAAALRASAADRGHRRPPRRRPRRGRRPRRHPPRHGRPQGLRRELDGPAPPRGGPGAADHLGRARAASGRPHRPGGRPAGVGAAVPGGGHPSRRARTLPVQARRRRPEDGRDHRGADPGHRGEAPPRAHRAGEGSGGQRSGRALRRRPQRPLRPRPGVGTRTGPMAGLRIATRGSRLALWQAERVAGLLGGEAELVIVSTTGDQRADVPIWTIGGTGVFVKEVQQAVLDGRADLAVHSAKDLPSETAAGLRLAAIPERADPRDALVGARLDDIPAGGRIATGSVRRQAQLAALRPDLRFASLRGNIETRVSKAADFDAVVVAAAALERLGLAEQAAEVLDPSVMLPQVAQGALAVECRADDDETAGRLQAIDEPAARRAVEAERAFLRRLGGGCDLPCGALARAAGTGSGDVAIDVLLATLDGKTVLRARHEAADPEAAGAEAARILLDEQGGRRLLDG